MKAPWFVTFCPDPIVFPAASRKPGKMGMLI
jgi:hypothetical protein